MKKTLLSIACLSAISISQQLGAQVSFNPAVNYATGNYPFSITSSDFNGDGFADIATANYSPGTVSVLMGNGTGSFAAPVAYTVGTSPNGINTADVNMDGFMDIITTNSLSDNVSVLLGNGSGGFAAAMNYATGTSPQSCVVGDFNNDGTMDLAVSNRNSSSVSVLPGNGTGVFGAAVNYGTGFSPSEITIGDFNGDGKPDLATVNNGGSTISVLLNDGAGGFLVEVSYAAGANPFSIHAADFNHDGKTDITVANTGSSGVSVFLGDGLGAFATLVSYATGEATPYSVRSGDFNKDGIMDLATANNGSNSVSVLLGDGSGAYPSSGNNYGAGQSPISMTIADFNNDSKQDIAVVNPYANTISVLINASVNAASALNFDGNNDYISAPDQPILNFGTGDFTIEANFKSSVSQPSYTGIVSKATTAGTPVGFQLVIVNNRIAAEISDGSIFFGTSQGLLGTTVLTDGNWHHLAMVVDHSLNQIRLLVDGNIEATVASPNIATLNVNGPAPLLIGVERTYSTKINGSLDEVRIWNVARTQCEIISYKNCEIPTTATGLVANYHFNQGVDMASNTLLTTLTDASGNAIDGMLSNFALSGSSSNWVAPGAVITGFSTPVACQLAAALNFDGNNDKVDLGTSINAILDPLNTITIEAWVNPSSVSNLGVIIGNYANGNDDMQFLLRKDFDQYAFWVSEGSGLQVVNSGSATVLPNTWQHVAGVWNGSDLKIYIDGVLKGTTTGITGSSFESISNPIVIGYNNRNENFSGSIDEIRMWTTARSQCEINTYKDSEIPGSSANLLLNYHFNQGIDSYFNLTETVLTDASGNGYNFTLNGFDLTGPISNWVAPGGVVSGYTTTTITPPVVTVNSGTVCAGQSFTLVPGGALTYSYSGGTDVVMPTSDASYTVTGADANGCENMAISSVTVNALPTIMATTSNTLLCTGETATLSVTGSATSYSWSTTETTMDIAVSPTTQTTYTVDGTDANGCSNTTTITQDVSLCTGIVTLSNSNVSINVYPNPNKGLFTVELTTVSKVTVTNALGEVILAGTMEAGKHNLTIQDQATGIYFVKVIENNKQQVIKIIKE